MNYKPLDIAEQEIRVITLHTVADGPEYAEGPVHCRLEHVSIDPASLSEPAKQGLPLRGSNHIWTLDENQRVGCDDFPKLFRYKRADPPLAEGNQHGAEDGLPWRFGWGDYVALSYVWGSPSPVRKIFIDGVPFYVRTNLELALRQLRKYRRIQEGFKIWVDAISINQDDVEERSEQVARMKNIFKSAWHVLVWLGKEKNNSDLAMAMITYLGSAPHNIYWNTNPFGRWSPKALYYLVRCFVTTYQVGAGTLGSGLFAALTHFFNRPYWKRLWIIQEIALGSPGTPVLCGEKCIQWRDVVKTSIYLLNDKDSIEKDGLVSYEPPMQHLVVTKWDLTRDRLTLNSGLYQFAGSLWKHLLSLAELQADEARDMQGSDWKTALFLSRTAEVTDERDRVFGMLGLSSIANAVDVIPNYMETPTTVFVDFTRDLVRNSNSLNVLRYVNRRIGEMRLPHFGVLTDFRETPAPTLDFQEYFVSDSLFGLFFKRMGNPNTANCDHSLPSWAPCWTCPGPGVAPLVGNCRASGHFNASPRFLSTNLTAILQTQAVLLDTMNSLSAFHRFETDRSYPHNGVPTPSIYGNENATADAFWRTLVTNCTLSGANAPDEYDWILTPELWKGRIAYARTNYLGLRDFFLRNASFLLFDTSLDNFLSNKERSIYAGTTEPKKYASREKHRLHYIWDANDVQRETASWAMNVLAWRRLVTTMKGYLGLVPGSTQQGDVIAVLMGCDTPLVLRKSGSAYEVVGECYVHGIMHGEVLRMVEEGKCKIEEIDIC